MSLPVTSTVPNYYTGLIETSKTHFYGRAAAGLSFSDSVLRTFTRLWWAVSSFTQRRTTQFRHGIGPHGIEPRKSSTSAQQRPPPLQASPRADLHALALWLQLRRQTQLAGPNGLRSLPTPKYPRGCSFTTCSYCILAHFYGRAAAELSFSDLVLRTFTRTMKTVISYNNLELYLYEKCDHRILASQCFSHIKNRVLERNSSSESENFTSTLEVFHRALAIMSVICVDLGVI